jgi:hypothetical protein
MTTLESRTDELPRASLRNRRGIVAAPPIRWTGGPGLRTAAYAMSLLVVPLPTVAQTALQSSPAAPRAASQVTDSNRHIDAATVACSDLRTSILKSDSGTLVIASGPTGGGTFHARAPQCDFWLRPQFTYVMAKEGWCGVGYTCTAKIQGGR